MGFSDVITERRESTDKSQMRFASDFIKLTDEHRTIIRVLDETPEVFWSHYVPKGHKAFPNANKGKGISVVCQGRDACPVCKWNVDNEEDKLRVRKLYAFNVLDRTPTIICPKCSAEHYDRVNQSYVAECHCGQSFKKVDPQPRNKIQIMQKGVRIAEQLAAFEQEYGPTVNYDIKCDTRGKGQDAVTVCIPKQGVDINLAEILGDNWEDQRYDIKETVSPLKVEQIERILSGEGYFDVVGKKQS
jgi:hypothetical protein